MEFVLPSIASIDLPSSKINTSNTSSVSKWIIIVVVLCILIWAIKTERKDLFCTADCTSCGDGKGKYYTEGKVEERDNISTSIDKIVYLSDIEQRTVKWRRALLLTIIILCLLFAIMGKIPDGKDMFLMLLAIFIPIYGSYSYYQYHYYDFPATYIKDNARHIRNLISKQKLDVAKPVTKMT